MLALIIGLVILALIVNECKEYNQKRAARKAIIAMSKEGFPAYVAKPSGSRAAQLRAQAAELQAQIDAIRKARGE